VTPPSAHVAVLRRRYLELILSGEKTVESRLSVNRVAPFGRVRAGDRLFLKQAAGAILATAVIHEARFYELDGPSGVLELRERFGDRIGGSDEYWSEKRRARYATLLWLDGVRRLGERDPRPHLQPLYGRAWVSLGPHEARRSA
jgi:hypothetical protein